MAEGYTDENGVIVFTGDGEYSWTVSKEGYITQNGRILLDRDKTVEITLEPTPSPVSMGGMLSLWTSLIFGGIASIVYKPKD